MGWFWGGPAAATPSSTPQAQDQAQSTAQPSAQPPAATPKTAPASSGDDAEVHKFLEELMGEVNSMRNADQSSSSSSAPSNKYTPSKSFSAWTSRWSSSSMGSTSTSSSRTADDSDFFSPDQNHNQEDDNPNNEPRLSPLAESLLPTTMDCEQAFNQAFHCQSLGSQYIQIYRYGSMRSCGEHWDDFFFCMRAKGTPPGRVKENMIRDHYRQKQLAKYGPGKPSSEDVWKERPERVRPGEMFAAQPEAPQVSDAEYQKWEMERMERIRKGLQNES